MSGLLLIALAMANVPVYRLVGRRLFGSWGQFVNAVKVWGSAESLANPWSATAEESTADTRLGIFLACSAGAVLVEFLLLSRLGFGAGF